MLLRKRALVLLVTTTILLSDCTRTHTYTFRKIAAPDYRVLIPLDASHLKNFYNLTPAERKTLNESLRLIRMAYEPAVRYTFPANGGFVVLVSYRLRGQKYWVVLSSCHSSSNSQCKHECGIGFNFQTWEALALMETGRCQDAAPIWKAPLSQRRPSPVS